MYCTGMTLIRNESDKKKIKDFINDKIEKYSISLPVFYLISDYVSHESLKEFRKMSSILKI